MTPNEPTETVPDVEAGEPVEVEPVEVEPDVDDDDEAGD